MHTAHAKHATQRTPVPTRRLGRWAGAAGLVTALALATGCGGVAASGGPGGPAGPAVRVPGAPVQASIAPDGGQQVTVRTGDVRFEPSAIAVKAGQPVQLTLVNSSAAEHNFTLTRGVAQPVTIETQGRGSRTGTFTIDTPGTYEFICSVPGHALAGMRGTLTVQR
jgi:uncharacterized cupredoxin-like copper-binding protein